MRYAALASVLSLTPVLATAQTGGFTRVQSSLPQGFGYESASASDYDGDGDLDLLVVRNATEGDATSILTELYRNDGVTGDTVFNFVPVPFPAPTARAAAGASETAAWADADNDGDVDVLIATDQGTTLFRNDGGVFAALPTSLPSYRESWTFYFAEPRSSGWADYDNDGDLDLALPEYFAGDSLHSAESRLALYRNDAGTLVPTATPFPAVERDVDLTWGDVEGDGDLDLLYLSAGPHCIAPRTEECMVIYENDGGSLAARPLDFPGFEGGAADFGDFDLDGDLDVLLVAIIPTLAGDLLERAIVYRNDGGGFSADTLAFPLELWNFTAGQWADYDSDGDVDILVGATVDDRNGPPSSYGSSAFVFANEGGTLSLAAALPASQSYGTTTWADFDADGDLDFLTTGNRLENTVGNQWEWVYFTRLFRNDVVLANAPPSAPVDLAAAPTADGVALSWGPATDDHTPADALTYNIWVRTTDGQDIMSPMAVATGPHTGARLLPFAGNVGPSETWSLRDLAPASYTWAVQAIDNAFNGGPFSAAGAFTIGVVASEPGVRDVLGLSVAPSPARESAVVTLDLPISGLARLALFDALGRRVAVIHDGPLGASTHSFVVETSGLAPGRYLVRAAAAGGVLTRSVVVVR